MGENLLSFGKAEEVESLPKGFKPAGELLKYPFA